MPVLLVCIEGNIGAGKSTLMSAMRETLFSRKGGVDFEPEPVCEWLNCRDRHGVDLFSSFYGDMKRHAFTFQTLVLTTRVRRIRRVIEEAKTARIVVMERSFLSDVGVFCECMHGDGFFDDHQKQVYSDLHDVIVTPDMKPDVILYLDCPPEVCMDRVRSRGRQGEADGGVGLAYLTRLHDLYGRCIESARAGGCPVLRIGAGPCDVEELMQMLARRGV